MTDDEILAALAELAREELGFQGILRPEMRLVDELALDSVRLLTLALEVEHRFDVSFQDGESTRIDSVADLVRAIGAQLDAQRR